MYEQIFHHGRHRNAFGGTEGAVESAFHAFQPIIAPSKTSVYGRWMHVSEMPEGLIRAAFSAAEGVSEHSVVIISGPVPWTPRGGAVEKLKG